MGPYFAPEPSMRRSRGGGGASQGRPRPARSPGRSPLLTFTLFTRFPNEQRNVPANGRFPCPLGWRLLSPALDGVGPCLLRPCVPPTSSFVGRGLWPKRGPEPPTRCQVHDSQSPGEGRCHRRPGESRGRGRGGAREPGGAASARVGGAGRASSETRRREFSSSVFARLRSAVPKLHKRAARHEPSSPDLPKRPSGLGAGSPVLGFRFRRQGLCKSRGLRPARVTRAPTPWGGRAAPPRESLQFDCAPRSLPLADRF